MKQKEDVVLKVLRNSLEARNSRKVVVWETWKYKGKIQQDEFGREFIYKEDFMKLNSESIRRHSQQLQRADKLTGRNEIQASDKITKMREQEAKLKGYHFVEGQGSFI